VLTKEREQRRALGLAEPAGMTDQVLIRQVGVGGRARHAGEVVGFGQRVLQVDDRQDRGQRGGFSHGQRAYLLVSVQQGGCGAQVGVNRAGPQVEPGHHAALERDGQVMHGERTVSQPEVEDPGDLRAGTSRGPRQVGRVPVAVPPLPRQRPGPRGGAADQRKQDGGEIFGPVASGQVGG
jgi:hypothetical protein